MNYRTRAQWGAEYDVTGRALMTGLPVARAFIHHTVTNPTSDPAADMRGIERIDIGRFGVPSYSYVIHPSGVVLEGMGLHRGAHTIDNAQHSYNDVAFGVSFIGNFQNDEATADAHNAAADLLSWLVAEGHLRDDFTLSGHRDVYATACPGEHLYPLIGSIRESVGQPTEDVVTPDDIEAIAKRTAAYVHDASAGGGVAFVPENQAALARIDAGVAMLVHDPAHLSALSDADFAKIAKVVNDESAKRQVS